jgi:hypothetical protein
MRDTKHPAEVLADDATDLAVPPIPQLSHTMVSTERVWLRAVAKQLRRIPQMEAERAELLQSQSAMRAQLEHVQASEANLIDQRETLRARVQELTLYAAGLEKDSERAALEMEADLDALRIEVEQWRISFLEQSAITEQFRTEVENPHKDES